MTVNERNEHKIDVILVKIWRTFFQNGFIAVKFTATGNTVCTRLHGARKALTGWICGALWIKLRSLFKKVYVFKN